MKVKFSKSQWEEAGKKAGWIKTAQGRMNRNEEEMYPTTGKSSINIGAPGSPERVKQEYPNLIKKLQEAKAYGHPIEIAEEILLDAGINVRSLDFKSLLEVSGWPSQSPLPQSPLPKYPYYDNETIEAMQEVQDWIKENGIEAFRSMVKEWKSKGKLG